MTRALAGALLAASLLSGCAYVPELEPEDTFSYAEIASQVECETYYAAALLRIDGDNKNTMSAFDSWAMSLTLIPNQYFDSSLSVGATTKTVAKAGSFFQFALGGGMSPGGVGYEMIGTANARDEYQFRVDKLFETGPASKSLWPLTRPDGTVVLVHAINPLLEETCAPRKGVTVRNKLEAIVKDMGKRAIEPPVEAPSAIPNILDTRGFFGVHEFLRRSFAVNNLLGLPPKSLSYSKQYRAKVQFGVTPGWYVATGNTSPSVGGYRYVDNTVTIGFVPQPPEPKAPEPLKVIIVADQTGAPRRKGRPLHPTAGIVIKPVSTRTRAPFALPANGVSPAASETLTNSTFQLNTTTNLNNVINNNR